MTHDTGNRVIERLKLAYLPGVVISFIMLIRSPSSLSPVNNPVLNSGKILALLLLCVVAVHGNDAVTAPLPGSALTLKPGGFLVAADSMPDPHFYHTVILIVAHGTEGTIGLVVNQPDIASFRHAFPDLPVPSDKVEPLYYGGPLERKQLSVLVKTHCRRRPEEGCILDDVYFTAHYKVIKALLQKRCGDKHCRLFAGFASWAPRQLEQELLAGSWLVTGADPDLIFASKLKGLWERLFEINHGVWARNN